MTGDCFCQGSDSRWENLGAVKGTIKSDLQYLVVSNEVRRHRLISISYILIVALFTAEAGGSSPVVPANSFEMVYREPRNQSGLFGSNKLLHLLSPTHRA